MENVDTLAAIYDAVSKTLDAACVALEAHVHDTRRDSALATAYPALSSVYLAACRAYEIVRTAYIAALNRTNLSTPLKPGK